MDPLPRFTSFKHFAHLLDYMLDTHTQVIFLEPYILWIFTPKYSVCIPNNNGFSYGHNTDINLRKFKCIQEFCLTHPPSSNFGVPPALRAHELCANLLTLIICGGLK